MRLVMHEPGALSEEQAELARAGIRATNHMVPNLPDNEKKNAIWFWVLNEDQPVGLVTLIPLEGYEEKVAEVGVRFWEQNPRNAFAMSDWMDEVLELYPTIVVRCYARNRAIKRLLQRSGFRLNRIVDDIEFHSVTRGTFLGRRTEPRGRTT